MSHDGNERLLQGLYDSCMEFLRRQYPCLTEDELEEISAKIARARFREYE